MQVPAIPPGVPPQQPTPYEFLNAQPCLLAPRATIARDWSMARLIMGVAIGILIAIPLETTGLTTAIHEFGHALAFSTTYQNVRWRIFISHFQDFRRASQLPHFTTRLATYMDLLFFTGRHRTGTLGYTAARPSYNGNHEINYTWLGRLLGDTGVSAWVSLAGHLTLLLANTGSLLIGLLLRREFPLLGNMLIAQSIYTQFGGTSQIPQYPHSTWLNIQRNGPITSVDGSGHDFDGFAFHLSSITGWSQSSIAQRTYEFFYYTPVVMGLGYYFYEQTDTAEHISDRQALNRMLANPAPSDDEEMQALKTEFQRIYQTYDQTQRANLEQCVPAYIQLVNGYLERNREATARGEVLQDDPETIAAISQLHDRVTTALNDAERYMINHVPRRTLHRAKDKLFHQVIRQTPPPARWSRRWTVQHVLNFTKAYSIAEAAARVLRPAFANVHRIKVVFDMLAPIAIPVKITRSCCVLYFEAIKWKKEFRSDRSFANKCLATAELVTIFVAEIVFFIPPMHGVAIPIYFISQVIIISINYIHNEQIARRVTIRQQQAPDRWDRMLLRLKIFKQTHAANNTRYDHELRKWVNEQQQALQRNSLTPLQAEQFRNQLV